jgi:glycosyltransferase involved in cell wall biosynthesis
MKILVFIHSLLGGGAERVTANLANQWAEQGDDVTVVTVTPANTDFYKVNSSVKRIGLNLNNTTKSDNKFRTLRGKIARILALRKLLKTQQPDIALSMMVESNLTLALAGWGLRSTIKVGSERVHPPALPLGKLREVLRCHLYGYLDAIVALTEESARWLRQNTRARKVVVIPNEAVWPLPRQEPEIAPPTTTHPHRLLAVGRLYPQKGFDILIGVFKPLAVQFPNWNLFILGEGPERQSLEKQLAASGLTGRVFMPGQVGNLSDWYSGCDLFVLSSRYEGFPNALVEAMSYGLPAVSFDCPTGPQDIIEHGINGLVIDPDNPAKLKTGLESLMQDDSKRAIFSSRCVVVRDRFGATHIKKLWQSLFKELLK